MNYDLACRPLRGALRLSVLALAGPVAGLQTQQLPETSVLMDSGGGGFHQFGASLSVDGDWAAIAARNEDSAGFDAGAVRLFKLSSGVWVEDQKLIGSDVEAGDEFGFSVALSGTTLVCGARFDDDFDRSSPTANSGAAYVFEYDGMNWGEVAKLLAPDLWQDDEFGRSVAIEGDTIAVGALFEDSGVVGNAASDTGAVYVYRNVGGAWTFEAQLTAQSAAPKDAFGVDLALSSGVLAVGATGRSISGTVSLYRDNGGSWDFETELAPALPEVGEGFGISIALQAGRLAVGSPFSGTGGRVHLFSEQSPGVWATEHVLLPSDPMSGQDFGFDIGLDGNQLAVGSPFMMEIPVQPGSAYVYDWAEDSCTETWKLVGVGALPGDAVGTSIAISGCTILAGAPLYDEALASVGAAFVFRAFPPITTYCTAKVNSLGCAATMTSVGEPDLSAQAAFTLLGVDALNEKQGLLFYGLNGPGVFPFLGGTLCVNPPLKRSPILGTGGNSGVDDCSGVLSFDFAQWTLSGADSALAAGLPIRGQYWYRDPGDPLGSSLTDAISFTLCE